MLGALTEQARCCTRRRQKMTDVIRTRPFVSRSRSGTTTFQRLSEVVRTWRVRSRERRILLELDDRMLRDIGVTRVDVYREAMKPFWRA
jgi:uncharacterized protein YjiS (DUF1127 family)